jgi:hypothetical protein
MMQSLLFNDTWQVNVNFALVLGHIRVEINLLPLPGDEPHFLSCPACRIVTIFTTLSGCLICLISVGPCSSRDSGCLCSGRSSEYMPVNEAAVF